MLGTAGRRCRTAMLLTALLVAGSVGVPGAGAGSTAITVDAGTDLGPTNQRLVGFGWNTGEVAGVASLAPHTIRIDASLQDVSTGPGELDLTDLLERIGAVRAIDAEPLVILSYMPAWLADEPYGRDATKVSPSDLDAWQALIERVVETVATAAQPARRFEVWNEPDLPIFWQDSPAAFVEMAVRTHRAVAAVAERTGLPLEVGGPAAFFADPVLIGAYVEAVSREDLPLHFVSWHHYGNTPFLGPDGAEDIIPPTFAPAYPVFGRRNPATSPVAYGLQVHEVRALVDGLLATRPGYDPELVIDEWNLSAGGYDTRHDTNEGAAFAAATMMEMEAAGLDAADFYRAAGSDRAGDWGLVRPDGSVKPAWWVFHAWQTTAGTRLAVEGHSPPAGLFARASRGGDDVHVLLASFVASGGTPTTTAISLAGCDARAATIRGIDAESGALDSGEPVVAGTDGAFPVDLPPQSVRWLTASCPS